MQEQIEKIKAEVEAFDLNGSEAHAEAYRLKFLVRKGVIAALFDELKSVPKEEKGSVGKMLNDLKQFAEQKLESAKAATSNAPAEESLIDLTLTGRRQFLGAEHPVQKVLSDMKRIFYGMGFTLRSGPEIELDDYNFTKLNFPAGHPARDMQDTFFIRKSESGKGESGKDDVVLRTHTSPVQVRTMLSEKPPIRVICPGKVYRNEAVSARSYCVFHQIEGLYVDTGVTFADLKATIYSFAKQMFGSEVKLRFRPSYFPFTEPSAETDVSCYICGGKGCKVCKQSGWLEILGCGMVHPNVLRNCGIDPEIYSGYAFGMGVERTAMLRYGVDDIRVFFENDVRMLSQFE